MTWLEKISTFDASAQFSTSQEGLVASAFKAAIVAALAGGRVLTTQQLRSELRAAGPDRIRDVANELVADGLLEVGRRTVRPGPGGKVAIYKLKTARSLVEGAA